MDIATIIGLIGAFGFIAMSIDQPDMFINTPSLMIVLGGTLMVTLLRSSLGEFLGAVKIMGKTFKNKADAPHELIDKLVELSKIARKDGIMALEKVEVTNGFLLKGVAMLADGNPVDVISSTLNRDISITRMRHKMGAKLFADMGEIAPAMGMIGTLIGLVQMLANMSDPKAIGPAMAIALLTTMYGAILANVICIPVSKKLENQAELEGLNNTLIVEGVVFIKNGGNPRVLTGILSAFLSPKERDQIQEDAAR